MPVPPEKSVYLPLQLRDDEHVSITLEFVPGEYDVDGLWIDTTLTIPGMPVKFSWFLATRFQERLLDIDRQLSTRTIRSPFSLVDTDCSFDLTFVPDDSGKQFGATLSIRTLWGGDNSAVNLTIDRCTATYDDVQTFIRRMSSIE